jgi:hypothetical protein
VHLLWAGISPSAHQIRLYWVTVCIWLLACCCFMICLPWWLAKLCHILLGLSNCYVWKFQRRQKVQIWERCISLL